MLVNEAVSEHGKNMRLLATSRTTKVFWLCFLEVLKLIAIRGCGSNSCKQPARFENTLLHSKLIFSGVLNFCTEMTGNVSNRRQKISKIKEKSLLFWTVGCNSTLALLAAYLNTFQLRLSTSMASAAAPQSDHHQAIYRLNPREQLVYIQLFGLLSWRLPFVFICTVNWITLIR